MLVGQSRNPEVTVCVTHHLNENDKYVKACVRSLLASVGVEIEVIVVSDAPKPLMLWPDSRVQLIWSGEFVTVPDKWKEALRVADPSAKLFLMVSDDVMVSKYMIADMVHAFKNVGEAIIAPMSNCDATTRYLANTGFPLKMELEGLVAESRIIDYPTTRRLLLLPQDWIGFYCVMMPKSVIEKVGHLDPSMEVRHNDVDYCFRARALGIPSLIHLGVFCLHFGDKTIPRCTTDEQYDASDKAFQRKYHPTPEESGDLL